MDKSKFLYVTYIATTPDRLWQALTDGNFTEKYWNNVKVQSEWKLGASIRYEGSKKVWWDGEIIKFDPPHHLSYTFCATDSGEPASRVDFEIEQQGSFVKLTLAHYDFIPGSKVHERISQGWPMVMSNLKSLLETGSAMPGGNSEC